MSTKKCVVIYENDTGYTDCVAICDKPAEAYGEAYLYLCDDNDDPYYITAPEIAEGGEDYVIHRKRQEDGTIIDWCKVLFYQEDTDD